MKKFLLILLFSPLLLKAQKSSEVIMVPWSDPSPQADLSVNASDRSASKDYQSGVDAANRYFDDYKNTGTLTISLLNPLIGIIPAVISTQKTGDLYSPEYSKMKNPNFYQGYTKTAKQIRTKKVWTRWGIGLAANFLVLFATLSK